jgi:hypothetical protein
VYHPAMPGPSPADSLTYAEVRLGQEHRLDPESFAKIKQSILRERLVSLVEDAKVQAKRDVTETVKQNTRDEVLNECRAKARSELEAEIRDKLRITMTSELTPKIEAELRAKLTPEIRAKLKSDAWKDLVAEAKAELRKEVAEDLRKELTEEKRAAMRNEAIEKVRAEMAEVPPTEHDRECVRDYLRSVEVDCMTLADAASKDAEGHARKLSRIWWTQGLPARLMVLGAIPALVTAYSQHGSDLTFWAIAAVYFLTMIMITPWASSVWVDLQERRRETSSEYSRLADRVHRVRAINVDTETSRKNLFYVVGEIRDAKVEIDRKYWPDTRQIRLSRGEIHQDILTRDNPAEALRIAEGDIEENEKADFDEKLRLKG